MAITYNEQLKIFKLDTANTSYMIGIVDEEQFVGHIYYGAKIRMQDATYLMRTMENPLVPSINNRERCSFLDTFPMEYPGHGAGDYREGCIRVKTKAGHSVVGLQYESYKILDEKPALEGLPSSFAGNEACQTLVLTCKDSILDLEVELLYSVFEKEDIITRSVRVINHSADPIYLTKVYSACVDMDDRDYEWLTLHGSWARERQIERKKLGYGKQSVGSVRGESSHQEHPFIAWMDPDTTQTQGDVYAMHFVYSGNFQAQIEKSQFESIRVTMGINAEDFCWKLKQGQCFTAPEVVLTFSSEGMGNMTRNLHDFYRDHMIRSKYTHIKRPILINNWEATYFDFNTEKLLSIAKRASELGIEMLVMDDGWFGHRNDDSTSLGDWFVNEEKITGGLKYLVDEVNKLGLKFGIWMEPEMISPDSKLYEQHPDWAIAVPGRTATLSRNQYVLDLSRKEVRDYVYDMIESMSKVFSSADISYVKWDMNRTFSDYYSTALPPERQGEVAHRYVLGLYRCMKELTERFPEILFEGCAAGGNRFDIGILCYFPQIWGSDDTDALCRAEIEENYSYGYPLSAVSAHVSACPNHQTLRNTPLETRFQVACFGSFGYECNLCDMKNEENEAMKEQIALYKKWRKVLQQGTFYRGRSFYDGAQSGMGGSVLADEAGNQMEWTCVSEDGTKAVGMLMQKLVVPNMQQQTYYPKGLLPDVRYHFYNRKLKYNIKEFGDLVNTVSPVHIKQDSLTHERV